MSKPKTTKPKKKVAKKAAKKKPTPRRRVEKVAPALNKQIAESVATAGEPSPSHDGGPEWDPFYEWIKPLSPAALVCGILAEKHALNGSGVQTYSEYTPTSDVTQLRADLTKAAKEVHDAGIPYEWPDNVHDYYPEPPAPAPSPMADMVGSFAAPAALLPNPAESNDLCKDPGDGELDTLAHIITDLGYSMRAARFIRRQIKAGQYPDPTQKACQAAGLNMREASRILSKLNDCFNMVLMQVRGDLRISYDPAGGKN